MRFVMKVFVTKVQEVAIEANDRDEAFTLINEGKGEVLSEEDYVIEMNSCKAN